MVKMEKFVLLFVESIENLKNLKYTSSEKH